MDNNSVSISPRKICIKRYFFEGIKGEGEEIFPDEKMPNTIGNRAEYHFAKENLFQDIFLLLKFVK